MASWVSHVKLLWFDFQNLLLSVMPWDYWLLAPPESHELNSEHSYRVFKVNSGTQNTSETREWGFSINILGDFETNIYNWWRSVKAVCTCSLTNDALVLINACVIGFGRSWICDLAANWWQLEYDRIHDHSPSLRLQLIHGDPFPSKVFLRGCYTYALERIGLSGCQW